MPAVPPPVRVRGSGDRRRHQALEPAPRDRRAHVVPDARRRDVEERRPVRPRLRREHAVELTLRGAGVRAGRPRLVLRGQLTFATAAVRIHGPFTTVRRTMQTSGPFTRCHQAGERAVHAIASCGADECVGHLRSCCAVGVSGLLIRHRLVGWAGCSRRPRVVVRLSGPFTTVRRIMQTSGPFTRCHLAGERAVHVIASCGADECVGHHRPCCAVWMSEPFSHPPCAIRSGERAVHLLGELRASGGQAVGLLGGCRGAGGERSVHPLRACRQVVIGPALARRRPCAWWSGRSSARWCAVGWVNGPFTPNTTTQLPAQAAPTQEPRHPT
jgi:hypothetical protein